MKRIIDRILYQLKENVLAKRKSRAGREVEYKPLKEIKSVLFFWTAGGEDPAWQKQLSAQWKNIRTDQLCFVPVGVNMPETEGVVTLKGDDLGFGGKVKSHQLRTVLEKKYDLLVDLTSQANVWVNYVLMNTHAHCIAGRKKEGGIADIVVADEKSNPAEFINKLIGILSEINKY